MAIRSRGYSRGQRVFTTPIILKFPDARQSLLSPQHLLSIIAEDRRVTHPTHPQPARAIRRDHARIVPKTVDRLGNLIRTLPFGVRFSVPKYVGICLKRRIRREVLHAIKKTGSGSSRKMKRTRNHWSEVSC
ncbi:hypothetical protein [robinz microvirus RP_145]|nr:hypothetical protein [robinz microvirus RP_145]